MFEIPNSVSADDPVVVHLDRDYVDTHTVQQITSMSGHPAVRHARVMPDCHKGSGTCVGFTCHLTPYVSPGLIGGDIGCGVSAHPLPATLLSKRNGRVRVKKAIHACVPMGNGHTNVHAVPLIQEDQYDDFYEECVTEAAAFAAAYRERFGVDISSYVPLYGREWVRERCATLGLGYEAEYLRCMGTLGGGNHFVEVDGDDDRQAYYLVVHSGSRALGQAVYRYWAQHGRTGAAPPARDPNTDDDAEQLVFDRHWVLQGELAYRYFFDMIWAQKYASLNRIVMLSVVLLQLGAPFAGSSVISSTHNYIDFSDLVVRKGAIRAHAGEQCLVALNMRDGLLMAKGLGNPEWNWSAAHGCGRVLTRRAAGKGGVSKRDREAAVRRFREEMGDVESDSIVAETLDERPSAYREPAIVLAALGPTLDMENSTVLPSLVSAKGTN